MKYCENHSCFLPLLSLLNLRITVIDECKHIYIYLYYHLNRFEIPIIKIYYFFKIIPKLV
jgi:hypothetical protein